MKTFDQIRNMVEMSALSTIHVIHHPEKGYREKGGGYGKELSNKTKTFKSHDTAANSDNAHTVDYGHQDKKTGKRYISVHTTSHPGERVHTINHTTGEVTKGDFLHKRQEKAAAKRIKMHKDQESYRQQNKYGFERRKSGKPAEVKMGKNLAKGYDQGKDVEDQHPGTRSTAMDSD